MDKSFLTRLQVNANFSSCFSGTRSFGETKKHLEILSPVDGQMIGSVSIASKESYESLLQLAHEGFLTWRKWPAPKRGEIVRKIGDELREAKDDLGHLVSYEMGKSLQEGLGEVQEMIDICDYAVGLSRSMHGSTFYSERPDHRMYEQWHPLGVVGIISAFNFPVAVWSWNAMIATVCGNSTLWKPSEKTPLSAIATFQIIQKVLRENQVPEGVFSLVIGQGSDIGEAMAADSRLALISATGSTRMGKSVAKAVASRLGKSLLELGGNNAIILSPHANLKLAIPAIVFGAVGTCGQRCTTTRRLIVHESLYEAVVSSLKKAYEGLRIGNPLDAQTHVGPLIDQSAVDGMQKALAMAEKEGGQRIWGGRPLPATVPQRPSPYYVEPAIVFMPKQSLIVKEETFAPILYVLKYSGDIQVAIDMQNDVPQGLSSALFSDRLQETEQFLAAGGSDCGIANVNLGTSGAEIGGAFGGEKETGGGRESGSDSWKAYMRRQTNTINFSNAMPLAQGIRFEI